MSFFAELCQKNIHDESFLNIENHDEVITVNPGDSRIEGANEIISFPFEKWLANDDSERKFGMCFIENKTAQSVHQLPSKCQYEKLPNL